MTDWAGGGEISAEGRVASLDQLASLIDRAPIEALLGDIHAPAKGEPARHGDEEADLVKHRVRRAVHGFKAHFGADAETALVEQVAVTPANINDGKAGPDALPDDPGEVFVDSAYRGEHFGAAIRAKGGIPRIIATGMWGKDTRTTLSRLATHTGVS